MEVPKPPRTFSPLLVNAEGRWTIHHYARTESVLVAQHDELADGSVRIHQVTATALIYRCSQTGAERRWGIQ